MRNRITAFLVTLSLILALGFAHGHLTDRWGISAKVLQAAARLDTVPHEIGGWVGTDQEIGERQLEGASAEGYLKRQYVHSDTGEVVQVMILCGRPGPISVHPPTVCFVAGGVSQPTMAAKVSFDTDEIPSEFLEAVFVETEVFESAQRTYWGWTTDGQTWSAPDDPRVTFAGEPYLYKLYLITPTERMVAEDGFAPTSENVTAFIETMIDVLSEHLDGETE